MRKKEGKEKVMMCLATMIVQSQINKGKTIVTVIPFTVAVTMKLFLRFVRFLC